MIIVIIVIVVIIVIITIIVTIITYTRSPSQDFRQGLGCSGAYLFIGSGVRLSRVWVRKDGNLLTETGCKRAFAAFFLVLLFLTYIFVLFFIIIML